MAQAKGTSAVCTVVGGLNGAYVTWRRKGGGLSMRARYWDTQETVAMARQREMYRIVDYLWSELTVAQKNLWRNFKWKRGWSNYAYFMSVNLKRKALGLPLLVVP